MSAIRVVARGVETGETDHLRLFLRFFALFAIYKSRPETGISLGSLEARFSLCRLLQREKLNTVGRSPTWCLGVTAIYYMYD